MKRREPKLGENENASPTAEEPQPRKSPSHSSGRQTLGRKSSESLEKSDQFEARRSSRVSATKFSHDGDSWQETLTVCEVPAAKGGDVKMLIRSYYSNQRTGDRVWDEPPSGASRVLPAPDEMRKMAELQLQEMEINFNGVPDLDDPNTKESSKEKKKNGFFRRSSKAEKEPENVDAARRSTIQYKPESFLSRIMKEPPKKVMKDDTLDPDVQKAIALSMAESGRTRGSDWSDPGDLSKTSGFRDDEETLALAMALSLSEAQSNPKQVSRSEKEMDRRALNESKREKLSSKVEASSAEQYVRLSEEELFQRALEESKFVASSSNVASRPMDDGLEVTLSSSTDDHIARSGYAVSVDDDRKMPAKEYTSTVAKLPSFVPGQSVRTKSSERKLDNIVSSGGSNRQVAASNESVTNHSIAKSSVAEALKRSENKHLYPDR